MSTLFQITVTGKPDVNSLIVNVKSIHPDSGPMKPTPGFALMLLMDGAGSAPLSDEVDRNCLYDADWTCENSRAFVYEVTRLNQGTMKVHCTHPAWCEHISDGDCWETAAYDPAGALGYEECEPRVPRVKGKDSLEKDFTISRGYLPILPELIVNGPVPSDAPEMFYIPCYPRPCYDIYEKVEGQQALENTDFSEWVGSPVIWEEEYSSGPQLGILFSSSSEALQLYQFSSDSQSQGNCDWERLKWIAKAAFQRDTKNEPILHLNSILTGFSSGWVQDISIKGNRVELGIFNRDRYDDLKIDETAALGIVAAYLLQDREGPHISGQTSSIFDTSTPLGASLTWRLDRWILMGAQDILPRVAHGYIRNLTYTAVNEDSSSWRGLDNDSLISYYKEGEWPLTRVCFEVTDPAWVEHLKGVKSFSYKQSGWKKAKVWKGDPILWNKEEQQRVNSPNQESFGKLLFYSRIDTYNNNNDPELISLLQDAVQQGSHDNLILLGRCYHEEVGVKKNLSKAVDLFYQAYKKQPDLRVLNSLLQADFQGKLLSLEVKEVQQWLENLPEEAPENEELKDSDIWYRRDDLWLSICNAWSDLIYLRGLFLYEGYYLEQNQKAALKDFRQSKAAFEIGRIYEEGNIIKQNLKTAYNWYRKKQDMDPRCALAIARFYMEGIHVEKNPEKAYKTLDDCCINNGELFAMKAYLIHSGQAGDSRSLEYFWYESVGTGFDAPGYFKDRGLKPPVKD